MWLCMVIGLFICIFAFTRYHIGVSQLVQQDETYINGWNIILEFNDEDFVITNSGKETVITKKYREIGAIYMDEKNYYIGVEGDDLYVLPRKDFIIGKQEEFEIFISEKVVHEMWYIPTKLKNRFQVMRSRMKEMDAAHDTKVAENRRKKQEEKAKKKK